MTDRGEVELMLKNEQMERLRSYVTRGRELAHLGDAELVAAWLHQINAWADKFEKQDLGMLEDCISEMTLREIDLPFEQAKGAMSKVIELTHQREAELFRDPERLAAVEARLQAKIDRLRAESTKPRN
jgi:hypothetical protein